MQKFRTRSDAEAGTESNRREVGHTLQIVGAACVIIAAVLGLARETVTRRVTSRSLGTLAPGYAATKTGYLIYAGLIADFGILLIAINYSRVLLIVAAIAVFIVGSIAGIIGEVVTYRALKH